MYLNLFHNGKKYIYETGNNLNIGHLKEISEGILNSNTNKNILKIIYDNPSTYHKYINPNDNTFLRDLIPKGQKRAKFSIRLGSGNLSSDLNNIKILQKSTELDSKKNIFGNFSYMYSAQKKFNILITDKYNEFLLELRELFRRINETYEELYKIFTQSNINYSEEMSKNNKNDLNNKIKQISEYEFHVIKFFEKEKNFYEKINSTLRRCLMEQNGKIVVANKTMKELYKNMFSESNNNYKLDLKEKNEYISNIIDNPFKNNENIKKNKDIFSLEDELFQDKIFKNKSRKILHSLSSLDYNKNNINDFSYNNFNKNNNSNFNTNEFSENNNNNNNNKNNFYNNNFNNSLNNNIFNNSNDNNNINNMNNNNFNNNINSSLNNNNFNVNNIMENLKTNKSLYRNNTFNVNNPKVRKSKLMISTEVGPDGVQRGKITLFTERKKLKKEDDLNNNNGKTEKIKGEEENNKDENNNKLDLIKNKFVSKNTFDFSRLKFHLNSKKNMVSQDEKEDKMRSNLLKLNTQKNMDMKNKGTNMNKESKEDNKDNKGKKNSKNLSLGINEKVSDSTEYLKKDKKKKDKNKSNNELNKIDSKDEDNKDKKEENQDNKDNNNDNDNNKNLNENNKDKNESNNDINSNNKINDGAKSVLNNDDNDDENIDSEKAKKKKKNQKKERKKRKNSSEDNSSENDNESEKEKKKKEKKRKNSLDEFSKESERSKKDSVKDLFDLHLLKNLSLDKDNPYKKKSIPFYGNGKKIIKENELIKPEIPESEDSEEEKKKLALIKKKKKNHIKNKYDFLI